MDGGNGAEHRQRQRHHSDHVARSASNTTTTTQLDDDSHYHWFSFRFKLQLCTKQAIRERKFGPDRVWWRQMHTVGYVEKWVASTSPSTGAGEAMKRRALDALRAAVHLILEPTLAPWPPPPTHQVVSGNKHTGLHPR